MLLLGLWCTAVLSKNTGLHVLRFRSLASFGSSQLGNCRLKRGTSALHSQTQPM